MIARYPADVAPQPGIGSDGNGVVVVIVILAAVAVIALATWLVIRGRNRKR